MPGLRRSRSIVTLAVAALGLLVAASAVAGSGLVQRSSKAAAFTIPVPASWHYRNATYPSDHTTEYWTSPTDARSRVEVQVSGCVGCVEPQSCTLRNVGCRPAPEAVIPAGAISRRKVGKWAAEWVAKDPKSPYLVHGLVVIRHDGADIQDWSYVEIWVPSAQSATADAMLAGFRLS